MRNGAHEAARQRQAGGPSEAFDVDHTRPVDARHPQERNCNPGTGRDRDRGSGPSYDAPRENRVPSEVAEVAIRRMMCVDDVAAREKLAGVRGVERHPLPLDAWEAG